MRYALRGHSNISMPPIFRVNAQQFFLTYPQCTLNSQDILAGLQSVRDVETYVIGEEKHLDGHPHIHAYIKFKTKVNSVNPSVFDVRGFHPNIQSARNTKAVISYVKKEGNYISNLIETDTDGGSRKRKWKEILENATNQESFLTSVKQEFPRDYCLNLQRLKEVAQHEWPEKTPRFQPSFTQFTRTTDLQEWETENIQSILTEGKVRFSPSLVARGPGGPP